MFALYNPDAIARPISDPRNLAAGAGTTPDFSVHPGVAMRVTNEVGEPQSPEKSVAAIVAEVLQQLNGVGAHRISTPVRTQYDRRANWTLREYYLAELRRERVRRIEAGRNKTGTMEKDLAALSFWERLSSNPTIGGIDSETVQRFIAAALQAGRRATATGYCGHLRWILNEAKRANIIDAVPPFVFPKVSRRSANIETHRETLVYEMNGDILGTLGKIHDALECPALQLAFVCGASFGPRTEDLLTLRWSGVDLQSERPVLRYVAEKTGSFHVIPLAPFLVDRLNKGRSDETWLFPTLAGQRCLKPAKSRPARRTVEALRRAVIAVGFDFSIGNRSRDEQKPFQVLRATCNERFQRHSPRAGEWILGHAMHGINRRSYQNPGSEIFNAVLTLPQPTAFLPAG